MRFKQGKDKVQTLAEFLEQVDGRTTAVIEIKSLWDDDFTLTDHAVQMCWRITPGPYALMSFDPDLIARVAATAPDTVRGITADRVIDPYYDPLPVAKRVAMREMSHLPQSQPHFVSVDFRQLPFHADHRIPGGGLSRSSPGRSSQRGRGPSGAALERPDHIREFHPGMILTPRILTSLAEIPSRAVGCAGQSGPGDISIRLCRHAFCGRWRSSGSATARAGWVASHLLLEEDGKVVAAAPCYRKSHSMGEYIFDHGWADAYERAGGRYYPKLQVSVPFSPVTAPKLLAPTRGAA